MNGANWKTVVVLVNDATMELFSTDRPVWVESGPYTSLVFSNEGEFLVPFGQVRYINISPVGSYQKPADV